ncbi:MAG: ParB/RepB/Spo0J family partition protein [Verrucomicrobia bacterium]|nr:ParB/RepB/Spo0J family partition protein [Verrucomicrobiota bacterium]
MAKPALGRGLSALLGGAPTPSKAPVPPADPPAPPAVPEVPPVAEGDQVRRIPIAQVVPCPLQPRKTFPEESLLDLANSIREQGIVQPLIVRAVEDRFELIAGERRWRAAQMVRMDLIPVIVRVADDRTVLELALIENLQRENLNPIEEALGYEQLIGQFGLTQEEVSTKVGKSRALVANALRLLKLPDEVRLYIRDNRISVGHAKVILGLSGPEDQKLAAQRVIKASLSVRQTEDLIAQWRQTPGTGNPKTARKSGDAATDANANRIQQQLQEKFGTKVQLRYRQGKGSVEIRFFSDGDFERILDLLGIQAD